MDEVKWPHRVYWGGRIVVLTLAQFETISGFRYEERLNGGQMPLTAKGKQILSAMKAEYGEKKGREVFYASKNAGTISGTDANPLSGQLAYYATKIPGRETWYSHPNNM